MSNFTVDQEKIINSPVTNMLVSAGAGCGKSTVLTARIIKRISEGDLSLMQGYSFNVPDGAENVYYTIDTESNFGTVRFTLDGVEWSASEIHLPGFDLCHPSLGNGEIEVSCDFKDDPAMKVHGVAPTAKGIYIKYDDNSERYAYSACWNLDDEEYSISLDCYSEAPIDSMPVEVFQ